MIGLLSSMLVDTHTSIEFCVADDRFHPEEDTRTGRSLGTKRAIRPGGKDAQSWRRVGGQHVMKLLVLSC